MLVTVDYSTLLPYHVFMEKQSHGGALAADRVIVWVVQLFLWLPPLLSSVMCWQLWWQ